MRDVVFISRQRIVGATNGSSAYLLQVARAIDAAGFRVHLLQPSPDVVGRRPILRFRREMGVFATHRIRGVMRIGSYGVALGPLRYIDAAVAVVQKAARRIGLAGAFFRDRPHPYSIAGKWKAADLRFIRATSFAIDTTVIADYAFQVRGFPEIDPSPSRTAILMHDLFHARDPGKGTDSVATLGREEEIALLGKANAIFAIQPAEADFTRRELPKTTTVIVPVAATPVLSPQLGNAMRLLFVGSRTAPNTDGLQWFLGEVWPKVIARHPSVELDVVGSVALDFDGRAPDRVRFHGLVDHLAPFYRNAGIVVSPLRFGSGLKVKLIEALAHGKAIVATGVTLQGAEAQCAGAVERADDAMTFAAAIDRLVEDTDARKELAANALCAAKEHYASKAVHADLITWLMRDREVPLPPESPVEKEARGLP